jgi:hypothetical protein
LPTAPATERLHAGILEFLLSGVIPPRGRLNQNGTPPSTRQHREHIVIEAAIRRAPPIHDSQQLWHQ